MTQIFPEAGNMGRVLPEYLSNWTTAKVRNGKSMIGLYGLIKDVMSAMGWCSGSSVWLCF